jgi:hypothetical protein
MARGIARDMAPGWAVDLGEKALPGAPGPLLANIEGAIHRYLSGFTVMLQEQVHRVVGTGAFFHIVSCGCYVVALAETGVASFVTQQ